MTARPQALADELRARLGAEHVMSGRLERMAYAYDATGEKHMPDLVAFPGTPAEVAACVKAAADLGVPVVPRGAGTNLSGGTVPVQGGLVLNLVRMNRVLEIDIPNRRVVVEPGITNLALKEALAPHGYTFAPDPSSQKVSTIGGNISENAGGPHCLKYGVTTGHVCALDVVLSSGEVVHLGTALEEEGGYDLRGAVVGAEGTLAVVTRAWLRMTPLPPASRTMLALFADLDLCVQAVSRIIDARIIPAALELMDRENIELTRSSGYGIFPAGAEAALIIEVEGAPADLPDEVGAIDRICREMGATELREASTPAEQAEIWLGRRSNYGILARTSPYVWVQDVTVPRHLLAQMLRAVVAAGVRHGLRVLTVAHAGDGNLHPAIPFDIRDPEQKKRVLALDRDIVRACVELGGSITGEHGVGIDKLPGMGIMFGEPQLAMMRRLRSAFDPQGVMNPGKLIPAPKGGY